MVLYQHCAALSPSPSFGAGFLHQTAFILEALEPALLRVIDILKSSHQSAVQSPFISKSLNLLGF